MLNISQQLTALHSIIPSLLLFPIEAYLSGHMTAPVELLTVLLDMSLLLLWGYLLTAIGTVNRSL